MARAEANCSGIVRVGTHLDKSVQRLIDRCMSQGPDDRADPVGKLAAYPRASCRSRRPRRAYDPRGRFFGVTRGGCSDQLFGELQSAVMAHPPADERDAYRLFHDPERREDFCGQHQFDVLKCNDLGLGQYLLLSGIPKRRLSPDARDRLGVLRQNSAQLSPCSRGRQGRGRLGRLDDPEDRLPKVSDRAWLGIIRRRWSKRSRHPKQMGPALGEVSVENVRPRPRPHGHPPAGAVRAVGVAYAHRLRSTISGRCPLVPSPNEIPRTKRPEDRSGETNHRCTNRSGHPSVRGARGESRVCHVGLRSDPPKARRHMER